MHLIHVDTGYVRGQTGIDWFAYFKPEDVTAEVRELLPTLPQRVADIHAILAMPNGREIRPSSHCFLPYQCEFWDRCTANKPADWIIHILRLSETAFAELDADGVESKRDILRNFRSPQHSSASSMPCSQVGN